MAFHLRKLLAADSDEESPHPCHTCSNCDVEDCLLPPPHTVPHHRIPLVLTIMLCVLAFALLILSYLVLSRYRNRPTTRRRIRQPAAGRGAAASTALSEENVDDDGVEEEDQGGGATVDHHVWYIRTVGYPQSVIDSIAVFKYKRGEGLIEGTDCSVCLNEFEEDETLRLLPKCSHAFHLPCIDTWLRAHKNCPVCRAPIMSLNNVPGSSDDGNRPDSGNQATNNSETHQEIRTQETGEIRGGPGNTPTMPIQEDTAKIRRGLNPGHGEFRVLSDLSNHRVKMDPVRRSASLDLSSTSMANKEGNLDKQGCKNSGIIKLIKSASLGRLQKGPVSMKRSISLNGKQRLLRKNNNSRRHKSIYMHA